MRSCRIHLLTVYWSFYLLTNCYWTVPIFHRDRPLQYNVYCDSIDEVVFKTPPSSLLLAGYFNITSYSNIDVDRTPTDIIKKVPLKDMAEFHSLTQTNHVTNFRIVTLDLVFGSIKSMSVCIEDECLVEAVPHHSSLSFSMPLIPESLSIRYSLCPNLRKYNLNATFGSSLLLISPSIMMILIFFIRSFGSSLTSRLGRVLVLTTSHQHFLQLHLGSAFDYSVQLFN